MPDAIVALNQTIYAKKAVNVLCFSNMLEDSGFLQEFADEIRQTLVPNINTHRQEFASWDNITVSFLEDDHISYSVDVDFQLGQLIGDSQQQGLPPQVAVLASLNYVGARPNRGRIYFTGFTEAQNINGAVGEELQQACEAVVDQWRTGVTTSQQTCYLRILRRPSDVFPNYRSNPVSLVTVNPNFRTQRRRSRAY